MVSPGDVLGRSDPLICGNDDYIVLEGAQATVRPFKGVSSQTPNSYLGRPAVSPFLVLSLACLRTFKGE